MCIDPHNTNPKTKLIYLSCSTRNVKKTIYFCNFCQLVINRRFFGHFSCCMRDKLIWSLNLFYGDQCTYFDRSEAILKDNFIFSLQNVRKQKHPSIYLAFFPFSFAWTLKKKKQRVQSTYSLNNCS